MENKKLFNVFLSVLVGLIMWWASGNSTVSLISLVLLLFVSMTNVPKKNIPESKLWFSSKKYGWGWAPSTWQGWALILVYVMFILSIALKLGDNFSKDKIISVFVLPFIISTIAMIWISNSTGESLRWRWGEKENEEKNKNINQSDISNENKNNS